jgi:3-hydroxybutyryl-CoA dehydrogenase
MKVAVIASEAQQQELISRGLQEPLELVFIDDAVIPVEAEACIDLQFEESDHREIVEKWQSQTGGLLLLSSVIDTCSQLPKGSIRMNAWPGFLLNEIIEMAGGDTTQREQATTLLQLLHRKPEWIADQTGFIAPRVIASIINEAYLALEEKVSDKAQIDTAMQLGTNYPLGPFAWSQKIGLKKIERLLLSLAIEDTRYRPANLLTQEASV